MKPNQQATVYTLLERGTTQREIARITGIDRKTVRSYQRRWLARYDQSANSPGVATGSGAQADQIPPPWPPALAATVPAVWKELVARGIRVGKERVQKLMQRHGIRAKGKRRFVVTTDSKHDLPIAPNLLARDFTAQRPNQVWTTDISAP